MDATELMGKLKERLQQQQADIQDPNGSGSLRAIRAELDTLWACLEVLSQLIDGDRTVVVPNYYEEKSTALKNRVHVTVPRSNPSL